jgi:hypothetical protein
LYYPCICLEGLRKISIRIADEEYHLQNYHCENLKSYRIADIQAKVPTKHLLILV